MIDILIVIVFILTGWACSGILLFECILGDYYHPDNLLTYKIINAKKKALIYFIGGPVAWISFVCDFLRLVIKKHRNTEND